MVDGFLVIDKPAGITSHDVVSRVRRLAGTRRVGHTGTLDPFATGVLPVAVGEGTKAIPFLDEGEKEYEAELLLGTVTDTLDHTGTVLQQSDWSTVTESALLERMAELTGTISQVPPMYSAIKQGGQPLYKLARKGVEVERQPRQVTIYRFDLLTCTLPTVTVRVRCSRGTYIRSLADDLGRLVGCGACLSALRRTRSGPFAISTAITLEELASLAAADCLSSVLVSPREALNHLPEIVLEQEQAELVFHGRLPNLGFQDGPRRLTHDGRLVAVTELDQEQRPVLRRVFHGNG
ncbi:tRNA pseudouridine(55) synthase TruB [Trichlorobacter ammonificans]|uniref:tRNA pseudouridine synthase B n=1 Tax=Trichlorobacter ammonificans TaxID=2916410 RepID=A0ABN8HDK7_9BACT|nr:tRNA pseudouridine(55) synthase TruB [Trichlorobacter ammonificans]CAH2030853.1 tRNA pseudouridine synthase B [Trichlorobacter ammonificans]